LSQQRRWTREDDRALAAWYAEGLATREIGRRLSRTGAAVRIRAARLGLQHPEKKAIQPETSQIIVKYDDLPVALSAARKKIGLSQLELDDLSGLQTGYTGKLECGLKHYGPVSFGATLAGLGLALVLIPHGKQPVGRRKPRGQRVPRG